MSLEKLFHKHYGIAVENIDIELCIKLNRNFNDLSESINSGKFRRHRRIVRKSIHSNGAQPLETTVIVNKLIKSAGSRRRTILHQLDLDDYWAKYWQIFALNRISDLSDRREQVDALFL